MPYQIVRTVVRDVADDEMTATFAEGRRVRDERAAPEARRQIACAEDRESAMLLYRALSALSKVRNGRERVKVVRLTGPRLKLP